MRIPSFETDQWESNVEFGEGFYSSQRVFETTPSKTKTAEMFFASD